MKEDSFNQMDESWMKNLKQFRDQKVPESTLHHFSDSVEKEILKSKGGMPAFGTGAVVFSVALVLAAGLLIWQWPNLTQAPASSEKLVLQKTISLESQIEADVEVLKALGEWTEDDERAVGIPIENAFIDFAEFDLDIEDDRMIIGQNVSASIR